MLPESNDLVSDTEKPKPTASVFIKYRMPGNEEKPPVDEASVQRFVSASVPQLLDEKVQVLMVRAAPPQAELDIEQRLQTVLTLQMSKSSAEKFRMMALGAGVLILLMLGICIWIFLKSRALMKAG
jgi:type III secretion protein J